MRKIILISFLIIAFCLQTAIGADVTINPGTTCAQFQTAINNNCNKIIDLETDINCTGAGFNPLCSIGSFTGTLDGKNHKIIGLNVNTGLFKLIENATIKNLRLANVNIVGIQNVGGLAGESQNSNVTNCYVVGNITGARVVGGLTGYNGNTIINNSYFFGKVEEKPFEFPFMMFGGLAGYTIGGKILNSYAGGSVGGSFEVGAIQAAGGIAGENIDSLIDNCYTTNTIIGATWVGGLVGSNLRSIINNSHTTGSIMGVGGNGYTGGLVGDNSDRSVIANSYSTSIVNGTGDVGGLVGINRKSEGITGCIITKSYATGKVTGNERVGGLVGTNQYSNITNSYSAGQADGGVDSGGLVGRNDIGGLISNSYSVGKANGGSNIGGLVGKNIGTITYSFAAGNVKKALPWSGGLAGDNAGTISNSYWDVCRTNHTNCTGTGASGTCYGRNNATNPNDTYFYKVTNAPVVSWSSSIWSTQCSPLTGYPILIGLSTGPGGQSCRKGGACSLGCTSNAECNDNIACTDDYCDQSNKCQNVHNDDNCNDDNTCTDDICGTGGCEYPTRQGVGCSDNTQCGAVDCNLTICECEFEQLELCGNGYRDIEAEETCDGTANPTGCGDYYCLNNCNGCVKCRDYNDCDNGEICERGECVPEGGPVIPEFNSTMMLILIAIIAAVGFMMVRSK